MNLSDTERRILKSMSNKPKRLWSIDDIADIMYSDKQRPENWRKSVHATMRLLTIKTAHSQLHVVRTTPLGRGHTAEYGLSSMVMRTKPSLQSVV